MTWVIIAVIVIVVVALLLPFCVKAILNRALTKMDGYTGHIEQLRINLLKSKISLHNISIIPNTEDARPVGLVHMVLIVFKWKQLWRRILDLNIVVDNPQLFLVAEKPSIEEEGSTQVQELPDLKNAIEKLMSFLITVEVRHGQIRYVNSHSRPSLQIDATELNLSIQDLSNRPALGKYCSIEGACSVYEGTAIMKATLLPLEPTLTLDLKLQLKSINLVMLNDFFRTYLRVDISRGTLNLYSEVAVADNYFKGYLKPVLKDMNFISSADKADTILQKIWERIVAGFYNVLENKLNDQVATKIPIDGRLDDPHVRWGVAIIGILRNAFVKALTPSFDNVIRVKSI